MSWFVSWVWVIAITRGELGGASETCGGAKVSRYRLWDGSNAGRVHDVVVSESIFFNSLISKA